MTALRTIRDARSLTANDRRFVRSVAVANVAVVSVLATAAWAAWAGLPSVATGVGAPVSLLILRGLFVLVLTFACGLIAVLVWRLARPLLSAPTGVYEAVCAAGAVAAGLPQSLLLAELDDTPVNTGGVAALWAAASLGFIVSIVAAVLSGGLLISYRHSDERRRAEGVRAAEAAAELEAEELRVRQLLADRLHGSVQNRLVLAAAALDDLAADLEGSAEGERGAQLRAVADTLDTVAQEEVRAVSHTLFPTGANLDTFDAVRLVLSRLPPSVATSLELGPRLDEVDVGKTAIPVPLRLVVVYAVEEAVTNAVKHGARAVRVRADLTRQPGGRGHRDGDGAELCVRVDDDGAGIPGGEPKLHGLERHRARIEARGGLLRLEPGPQGGARLSITLPIADGVRSRS